MRPIERRPVVVDLEEWAEAVAALKQPRSTEPVAAAGYGKQARSWATGVRGRVAERVAAAAERAIARRAVRDAAIHPGA